MIFELGLDDLSHHLFGLLVDAAFELVPLSLESLLCVDLPAGCLVQEDNLPNSLPQHRSREEEQLLLSMA